MGACVSTPEGCVGGRLRSSKKKASRKRKKGMIRRRASSRLSNNNLELDNKFTQPDRSYINPTFHGSTDEAWFDSAVILDSDCDEDFQSVPDDVLSLNGFEGVAISSIISIREANHEACTVHCSSNDQLQRQVDSSTGSCAQNSVTEVAKNLMPSDEADSRSKSAGPINEENHLVYRDEVSSADEGAGRQDGLLDNCGILPHNCLPCLNTTVPTVDKRRSLSSSPPSARKKAAGKHSFKWRDGHSNAALLSSKMLLQRPLAGSQVPFCPMDKKMLDSWSPIEPCTFKVRGENYFRDKKKELAPNYAAYYPFGVDVFLSPRKVNHVARFVELPVIHSSGILPPILVVNAQIPLYPASLFQSETDGEGINIVLYFKLSDSYAKELPFHFQENIRRLIDDEVEKVKGFPMDTIVPFRERLKILGRVVNVDDLHLNAAERKLMHAYNEKPVLSRPQHEFFFGHFASYTSNFTCQALTLFSPVSMSPLLFDSIGEKYQGENYLEIDLDMHRFSYISRKGFETFLDRLKLCVLDFGLTIQASFFHCQESVNWKLSFCFYSYLLT
ncbi:hypothetical protein RHMOL_Rhmol12G0149300 [Rhododendron molle]|uniref:Uncharacterized protein n=1 Tax=Rhododendron molle TaxID=49168 RepID=A0ACC0LIU1_RHOML|nr:hypothetical protein RHMOL_Rhmol12G0149300 [Rhododendron molle]